LNSKPGERPKLKHATERYRDVFSKAGISPPDPQQVRSSVRNDETAPIGFAPCASTPEKTWIEEHSIALIEQMLNLGYTLRLFGSAEELKQLRTRLPEHKKLEWSDPRLGLGAEWRSMDELRGMIAMDSANLHLASLRGLQTLSVWGSTHPDAGFAPVGANHRFVQIDESQLDCRPCSIFGNVSCARHDRACLLWIKPESVLAEVVDLWPLNQPSSTEPAQAPSSKARP
jgi:ADP-heptose:LPS heptosyltransferase